MSARSRPPGLEVRTPPRAGGGAQGHHENERGTEMMLPPAFPVNRLEMVRTLAADLAAVFSTDAPEIDLVAFVLLIADEGRRRVAGLQ